MAELITTFPDPSELAEACEQVRSRGLLHATIAPACPEGLRQAGLFDVEGVVP